MLEFENVSKFFGGFQALKSINFEVKQGEFIGLIGPNGAGKTTLFNTISGAIPTSSGKIIFSGNDITGLPPYEICHLGIARTFQIPRPINSMSTLENVMLGILFGDKNNKSHSEEEIRKEAIKYLDITGLGTQNFGMPGELPLASLRRLELARALATKPKLLLVDEFMSGLNKEEAAEASRVLKKIRQEYGLTIIWVEHVMDALMNLVERVIVLNYGEIIADGEPAVIANDENVIEVYLGE